MARKNSSVALDISKSQLGKLLASENIRIEHQKVQGPYFDVKNRVLVLPLWKDMDADLYDLMIGHEVGHALFTPPSGWENKIKSNGIGFKTFLNLVEDARIEKKMKRKYPGLKKPMYSGYTQLVDRGFFGIDMHEMKHLPFADRVNVYFKLGARADISFTEKEMEIVDLIENAETWDEVVYAAEELYKVAKTEQNEMSEMLNDLFEQLEKGAGESQGEGEGEGEESDGEPQQGGSAAGKTSKNVLKNASEKLLKALKDWVDESDSDEISSITENAMKDKEKSLIDASSYPYLYLKMPEIQLKNWVVPSKVVHSLMSKGFTASQSASAESQYRKFVNYNKRYVDNMVKEFELRRNAKQLAKAKVSKSGELDIKKVWKYKLSDDLFMQTTVVPNGKNHGMLMLIDMSSSMVDNIAGTIEQVLCMSMFCRKVGIPFDVYSFINNGYLESEFGLIPGNKKTYDFRYNRNLTNCNKSLIITDSAFRLQQLLNNKMGFAEYNDAVKNLVVLANAFKGGRDYYSYSAGTANIPPNMHLSGTPLNEAIVVLNDVAKKFREETKVEILTTVVLTDGEASRGFSYIENGTSQSLPYEITNIVLEDPKTKKSVVFNTLSEITLPLLEMYKKNTDSRVIGYYLMSGGNYKSQIESKINAYNRNGNSFSIDRTKFEKQYTEQFLAERFYGIDGIRGYDTYFMLPGSELEIEEVTMDSVMKNAKVIKSSTLLSAFKKMQNSKQASRVFVKKFIGGIS